MQLHVLSQDWSGEEESLSGLHYATHDTRMTHGHRILRLGEDFEMLRMTPDVETLRLTCDFKTLRQTPARCQPDTIFQNQASDTAM